MAFRADDCKQIRQEDKLNTVAVGVPIWLKLYNASYTFKGITGKSLSKMSSVNSRSRPVMGKKLKAFYGSFISWWVPLILQGRLNSLQLASFIRLRQHDCIILLVVMNWQELCVFYWYCLALTREADFFVHFVSRPHISSLQAPMPIYMS